MIGLKRNLPLLADFFYKVLISVRLISPDSMMNMDCLQEKSKFFLDTFQDMKHGNGICPSGNSCRNNVILLFQHLIFL